MAAHWLLALAVGLALAVVPPAADPVSRAQQALREVVSDPAPKSITNSRHYLITNERRLDLFANEIAEQGGVHLGVGAGQNYMLAGWSRPSLMILVDYDQDVVDLHAIYSVLLAFAATPQAFRALWTEAGEARSLDVLALAVLEPMRSKRLRSLFTRARPEIDKHLGIMQGKFKAASTAWYLSDRAQYDHVAQLARQDRIIARRGDFTQPGTVLEVAGLLRASRLELGTLYLSNIEQYFMYSKAFKRNMLALPLSDHAQVLRTLPGRPAGFEYIVQDAPNFRAWMHWRHTYSVYRIRGIGKGEHLTASIKHRVRKLPPICTRSGSSVCP